MSNDITDFLDDFDDDAITVTHDGDDYTGIKNPITLETSMSKGGRQSDYDYSVFVSTAFSGGVDEYVTISAVEYIIDNIETCSAYTRLDLKKV
jgi:hypothetical protein